MAAKYFLGLVFFLMVSLLGAQGIPNEIPKEEKIGLEEAVEKVQETSANKPALDASSVPKKEEPVKVQEAKNTVPANKAEVKKTLEDSSINVPEVKYTERGVFEIGGLIWGEFKAMKSGDLAQGAWINAFFSVFVTDFFLMGLKGDVEYYLDPTSYMASGYLVAGAAFPLSESIYMAFTINLGYSYNNTTASSSLFSYGNEVALKIELAKHFLLGVGAVYTFHTDFSKDFFNDKIKGLISFSGYF